jgi:parvulin-like peptidyl-prolyl isomerase
MNKRTLVVGAVAVALAAGSVGVAVAVHAGPFAAEPSAVSPSPQDLGPVIATVDGQAVYLSEMRSRVQGIAKVHGDFEKMFGKDWKQELLQNLVDDKIIEQQAAAMGIVVTDDQIQRHVDLLRSQFPTDAEYQAFLKRGHMSEAELAQRIRLQTIASELYLKVTDGVTVTRADLRAYYARHQAEFPGVDGGSAPFLAVKDQIRQKVDKRERDAVYGAWLQRQRAAATVVVVMPDWWKEIR